MKKEQNKTEHNKKEDQLRTVEGKKRMLEALKSTLGIVTPALEKAAVSRTQYYQWLKDDPEFEEATKEADEIALDFSESKLHKLIKDEVPSAVFFHLKTKGKKRGYVERQETEEIGDKWKIVFENVSAQAMDLQGKEKAKK